jgi:hypothetical protein
MPAFPLPFFVDAGASPDRRDLRLRARIAACAGLTALSRAENLPFEANFSIPAGMVIQCAFTKTRQPA